LYLFGKSPAKLLACSQLKRKHQLYRSAGILLNLKRYSKPKILSHRAPAANSAAVREVPEKWRRQNGRNRPPVTG
jgi:hypothetical protein